MITQQRSSHILRDGSLKSCIERDKYDFIAVLKEARRAFKSGVGDESVV